MDDYYDGKYPGLSAAIENCYNLNMGILDVFFHFSELLSGHERDAVDHTFADYGDTPPFRYDDCRILMTGLSAQVYHGVFGWCQPDAMAFFVLDYKPYADALLARYGYRGISLLYLFDGKKRLVTIFSPIGGQAGDALAMAEELGAYVQARYQERLLHGSTEYCNFTVLSDPILCFDGLAPTFARMQELADCSFFMMEPVVLTPARLEAWRAALDGAVLSERFHALQDAVSNGDEHAAHAILNDVFLTRLKYSFSFRQVEDAMAYCKSVLHTSSLIHGVPRLDAVEQLCDYRRYPSIERCCEALSRAAASLCRNVGSSGRRLGRLTKEAVYFIRTHYAQDLSLSSIAGYVNVVPTYLSSVFKRETGETVNHYLINVRMERARELLSSTNLKIAEVAQAVGIRNTRYFSACFKREVGESPNDYRAVHRGLHGTNGT